MKQERNSRVRWSAWLARYMNTLLIGKAEVLPEIREDIQRMVDNPGIWIVTDENQPGAEIPVVSISGKLYAIELSTELAPERFLSTARVAGGPYRANARPDRRGASASGE